MPKRPRQKSLFSPDELRGSHVGREEPAIPNPQSPIPNPQSPIPNPQSLLLPPRAAAPNPRWPNRLCRRFPLADPPTLPCHARDDQPAGRAGRRGLRLRPRYVLLVESKRPDYLVLCVRPAGQDVPPPAVRGVQVAPPGDGPPTWRRRSPPSGGCSTRWASRPWRASRSRPTTCWRPSPAWSMSGAASASWSPATRTAGN